MAQEFNILSPLLFYNFFGKEIIDESDLKDLCVNHTLNQIIFFRSEEGISSSIDAYRLKCFKLIEKIGEGGFGKVYLAQLRFDKQYYAIKFLKIKESKLFFIYIIRPRSKVRY